MEDNKKRYWLRGGVISTILLFFPLVYLQNSWGWEVLQKSFSFKMYLFLNKLPLLFSPSNQLIKLVLAFIIYFFMGAVAGWIYGKIKNRKKPPLNT